MKHILGLTFLAVAVLAAPASAGGFYVGAYGGLNYDDVIDVPFVQDNTGAIGGIVVGTKIASIPGLRVEGDLSFRSNDVDVFGSAISASHDTTALMANAVYDIPISIGPAHPYALIGVGYANTQATFENIALARLEASGVAYQLGAGLSTEIADGVVAGLGYRYFVGPEIEVLGLQLSDGTNHSVVGSLTFKFD